MVLRSTLARLAMTGAAGALALSASVVPAMADDGWGGDGQGNANSQQGTSATQGQSQGQGQDSDQYQGLGLGYQQVQGQGQGQGQGQQQGEGQNQGQSQGQQQGEAQGQGQGQDGRLTRGVVTARGGLLLRSAPTRSSEVIRMARQGETVSIFCQTRGESVDGNRQWYLLTDGTWAWGAARYIHTFDREPRPC
ncbi:SH3 domain-containing protein [Streptomyces lasalocidi]|uniref:SH3 domain-containing protein n=2 Tax=Streptomyces lasalocidi TaxID=324833 RepID=A0A4U5WS55_STRLS|nr:SH3 domain-containing protein [Streptomyces lasalocidi]TKT05178.1 SH3 domain-containing protein [Streptomyces lasalocidi]